MIARRSGNPLRAVFRLWTVPVYLLILFWSLGQFAWIVNLSFIPDKATFVGALRLATDFTFQNYANLFEVEPFAKFFFNSTFIAVSVVLAGLLVAVPAAYALARFRFPGRRLFAIGLLLIYMIPGVVILIPLIIVLKWWGLLNTYQGLIIGEATGTLPFAIWLLSGYFAALPKEQEEAALVDGCTPVGALVRVVLPLALPGIITAGLFMFIGSWNNFLFAFMVMRGDMKTLPVAMAGWLGGEAGVFYGTVSAGAVLITVPVALLFLFFQRYLVTGLAAGAVKG